MTTDTTAEAPGGSTTPNGGTSDFRAGAEVRGRALGVSLLAFFAIGWTGWGTGGHLPTAAQVPIVIVAAVLSSVLAAAAWRLARRVPAGSDATPEDVQVGRRFTWIVAVSWAAVIVAAVVLGMTGHAEMVAATVCAGIGVHFLPLARLFYLRAYYVTGAALCLISIVTFVLAPATSNAALWTLIPGVGAAIVLYATCAALLSESRGIASAT
ncbi:MAG TPA: hypothetical protein VH442_20955 [Micromonosporaceae bacterium]|jgi:hypothetical protein